MAKQLMKGCEAIAEAAIQCGCRHFFGYPITPQNDIPEYMSARMPKVGGCFLQAESEVAAINMVYGAAAAGARVMTSSSSTGISLKLEGVSYIAGARLPCVIVNMMRGGPGLGNIQASQSDYFQTTKGGGHGDYHVIAYAPASVQEAIDLMETAYDRSEKYRVPVFMLADGIMGQMMEPVELKENIAVKSYKKDWATTGWSPKSDRPRAVVNSMFITSDELQKENQRLQDIYREIEANEILVETYNTEGAEFIITAYGTVARICKTAIAQLKKQGVNVGMVRPITVWPFPYQVVHDVACAPGVKKVLNVEMSAGQMIEDVKLALNGDQEVEMLPFLGTVIPTAEEIAAKILEMRRA